MPPHDRVVPNFGLTEFSEFTNIFRSTPEKTGRLEVRANGNTIVTVVTPSQLGTPVTPVMSPDFAYYFGLSS